VQIADDWFEGFHTGLVARLWRAVGAMSADEDAALVADLLGLQSGARVLDVPCGDGRVAIRLAERGLEVHGIDISREEIEVARAAAAERSSSATFEPGDMRALPESRSYDGVVTWGNSFGYLPPAETQDFLGAARRILREGGRLTIQTGTVAESSLPGGIPEIEEHEIGGVRMLEHNRYDPVRSVIETDYVFQAEGEPEERRSSLQYVHTSGEIVRMLEAAGFAGVRLLDADGRTPYELASPLLIVLATA
jgi:ubiquinone/menaquinone biosynthesis C-methylase UbiE